MIASSNVWNIDNTFSNLDIKWDIAYIVLDFLRCLSGKDRNKTINEIYKRNAPRIRTIEENKKLTEEGFLYIISNSKYFKIGVTRDLNSRFQTLKSASSVELQIVHSEKINGYRLLEKEIHKTFSDKRVSREWFDLTDKDIDDIKLLIKNWIDRSSNTNKEATCSSNTKSDYFWAKYIFSSTDDA